MTASIKQNGKISIAIPTICGELYPETPSGSMATYISAGK